MMSANYISQKKDAHRIYCRIVSVHHIVISLRTNILFLYLLLFAKYYILLQPHNAVHFFIRYFSTRRVSRPTNDRIPKSHCVDLHVSRICAGQSD